MEEDTNIVSEPAMTLLSEEVRKSGLLAQVMKLSQPDKVALVKYLNKSIDWDSVSQTDDLGRVKLSSQMRETIVRAERDFEEGKCFSEDDFKVRFAKWL